MSVATEYVSRIYDGVVAGDTILSKSLRVSGQVRSARIETRLRELLIRQWAALAKEAAKESSERLSAGRGDTVSAKDIENVTAAVDRIMSRWASTVRRRYEEGLDETYTIGRDWGLAKAVGLTSSSMAYPLAEKVLKATGSVTASFDQIDYRAINALGKHQVYWIDTFYEDSVSGAIADAARSQIAIGMGREEAGRLMAGIVEEGLKNVKTPGGYAGDTESYFEGLVANATTSGRVSGHLRSFDQAGIQRITVVNPIDQRTCEACEALNGMIFEVSEANSQLTSLIGARNPQAVRDVQPWLSKDELISLAGQGSAALVSRGVVLPTYHFRCRCDIDIEEIPGHE